MKPEQFRQWLRDTQWRGNWKLTHEHAAAYLHLKPRTVQQYALGKRYNTGGGHTVVEIPKLVEIACEAYKLSL